MQGQQPLPTPLTARGVWEITTHLEYLRLRGPGDYLEGTGETKGRYALGALTMLTNALDRFGVLQQRVASLREAASNLERKVRRGDETRLDADDVMLLDSVVSPVREAFSDYLIENDFRDRRPKTGIFNYDRLLADATGTVFQDPDLVKRLSPEVDQDTKRSASCLAAGLSTASVLLSLRAAEGALRDAYARQLKTPPGPRDRWYDLADELFASLKARGVDTKLISGFVDGLRLLRNSAMHPGTRFSIRDAEDSLVSLRQLVVRLDALPPPT